jgi:hypothetical protein
MTQHHDHSDHHHHQHGAVVHEPGPDAGEAYRRAYEAAQPDLVQGWVVGCEGFSQTMSIAIVLAWVLDLAWMIWLVVVAWRGGI